MNMTNHFRKALQWLCQVLARQPLLAVALLLALQTVFLLDSRALWFSDEIRYANVFDNLLERGKWLVLYLNGEFYPDKPPVFFWLLWLLHQGSVLAGKALTGPPLFFLGAAVSGLLYLTGALRLARLTDPDPRLRLATGLMLLTTFYFIGLTHYLRMDLLFGALILAAEVCLFRAWQKETAHPWTMAGFSLAALAVLTKGPLGLALPVLGSLVYLAWVGRLRRFWRLDVWRGFALGLVILAAWLTGALILEHHAYIQNIFVDQIYRRATDTWHHEQPFYHYLFTFPAAFLPWTLLLVVLPMGRLLSRDFWRELWQDRRDLEPGQQGTAYCWALLLSGFLLLSVVSIKIVVYLLPLFAPLTVLAAQRLVWLGVRRSRILFGLLAGLLALVGAVLPFVNLLHPWPVEVQGGILCGLTLLLLALGLWKLAPRELPLPSLLFLALGLTLWVQPVGRMLVPSLDAVMSPQAQGELMAAHIDKGYVPFGYKLYSGTYTWYAGQDVRELTDLQELEAELARTPKAVLGLRKRFWNEWPQRPEHLRLVHEQWIADREYVLVVQDALPKVEAAEAPPTDTPEETRLPRVEIRVEALPDLEIPETPALEPGAGSE